MKKLTVITLILVLFAGYHVYAKAESSSIGISPAQISIVNLKPGLSTTRQIIISRSITTTDEIFLLTTDNTEGNSWLSFNPGKEIIIKAGENRAQVIVTIAIPSNALYKRYSPVIHITQRNDSQATGVSIQSGVVLNFDLLVSDIDVISLKVLSAKIDDLPYGSDVVLYLNIENSGNIAAAPARVSLIVSDARGGLITTLESTETTIVKPLSTESQQITFLGTNLQIGDYLSKLTVYDTEDKEMFSYDLSFRVTAAITPTNGLRGMDANTIFYYGLIVIGVGLCALAAFKIAKGKSK